MIPIISPALRLLASEVGAGVLGVGGTEKEGGGVGTLIVVGDGVVGGMGFIVGDCVGTDVGDRVGPGVDSGVGAGVESGVGAGVGTGVGTGVGAVVGTVVGAGVGCGEELLKAIQTQQPLCEQGSPQKLDVLQPCVTLHIT